MKFLTLINGIMTLIAAVTSSSGSSSAGNIVALNSSGLVDSTMLPAGIASGNIDGGNPTSIYILAQNINGGTP
jgi:hypothetical protein